MAGKVVRVFKDGQKARIVVEGKNFPDVSGTAARALAYSARTEYGLDNSGLCQASPDIFRIDKAAADAKPEMSPEDLELTTPVMVKEAKDPVYWGVFQLQRGV
jgi:hypothetical protein